MRKSFLLAAVLLGLLTAPGGALAAPCVEGEALVVFKKAPGAIVTAASVERGAESFRLAALAAASGARVVQAYGALSEAGDGVFALVRSETVTAEQLVEDLRARADVLAAAPNYITRAMRQPNDPRYASGELWGLKAIRAPEAWDVVTGSTDVYVAVADTGIHAAHEDLRPNLDTGLSRDFSKSSQGYADAHGHGTHVAGTIGAVGNNGLGVAGVSWTTRLIALRIMGADGAGPADWTVEAFSYLISLLRTNPQMKIAAINLSLGGYADITPSEAQSLPDPYWLVYKILDNMDRTVIVVAAGNEGLEVGKPAPYDDPSDPANPMFRRGQYCYPASFTGLKNLIVVGAAASDGSAAVFSNWSPTAVSLAAPGVNILSTVFPSASDPEHPGHTYGSLYGTMSGTSQATPHVAGAVALLASRYPNATASQIKDALLRGANGSRNPVATARTNTGGAKLSQYGYLDVKQALDILEAASTDLGPKPQPDPKPNPDPKPQPNPMPQPDPGEFTSGDVVVPTTPSLWTIIYGTPDARGNTPVTIRVPFSTQKELISASVETRGLDSVRATIPEKENASSAAASPSAASASLTYTLQITGTVARENLSTAAIEALNCRLEGDAADTRVPLGATGIPLSGMTDRSPLLPDPNPGQKSKSSGGCNGGFLALGLLALAFLPSRRR